MEEQKASKKKDEIGDFKGLNLRLQGNFSYFNKAV